MDIKDSYLHGTVGVVKSISVTADKLTYRLADVNNTAREVTLPLATTSANGLLSSTDKAKLDAMVANSVANNLILKINTGSKEGTSLYTYNGSSDKTLDIKNGTGIGFTNTAGVLSIYNSGVRSISTGTANGTISVNTNGTSANVAVKGLGSAAYTDSDVYAVRKKLSNEDLDTITTPGFYNSGGENTCTNKPTGVDYFGMIVTHCAGGSYYVQILFEESDSTKQWRRHCINGTWSTWTLDALTDTTYSVFTGATSSANGTSGLVPTPTAGNQGKFLKADGTWATPTNTTYSVVSSSANGLAPKVINTNTASIDTAYYLLASSDGSATPSWYKLPANAFANDDTKVTQTVTNNNANYPLLLAPAGQTANTTTTSCFDSGVTLNPSTNTIAANISGNAATATTATTATKLATKRKLWGQDFDGSADVSGDMTGVGKINKVFKITSTQDIAQLNVSEESADINYSHLYVSSNNTSNTTTRPLVLQYGYGNVGIGLIAPSEKLEVNGNVKATTLIGNLDGTYVNKLTGYTKATAIGSIAASDSLKTALGKLEFKTDFIYNDLFGTDNDDVINKWSEIVDFIDSVKEGTDITDEFVTRKTEQDITGEKTFKGTTATLLTIDRNSTNPAWIRFMKDNSLLGYLGIDNDSNPVFMGTSNSRQTLLHSGNYTNYINTTNFPGIYKTGTVTSITLTAGSGISINNSGTAITTSGTRTITNTGVRSTTINGNYLRVNTNGTNADLTIPYATNADMVDSWHVSYFSNNYNGSRHYRLQFGLGGEDKEWKTIAKTVTVNADGSVTKPKQSAPTSSYWSASTVKGKIFRQLGNYYQAQVVEYPFEAIFHYTSGTTLVDTATLYLPQFAKSYDNIRIVKLETNVYELQVKMISSWQNDWIEFQGSGTNLTCYESLQTASTSDNVVQTSENATVLTQDKAAYAYNAETLDGFHASGLLTALTSNTTNAVSITVGGTTKNITTATLKTSLGLGSNAYSSTSYLPLSGGTMTGTIEFNDKSASESISPMLKFGSNNRDTILWRVYSSDQTYANQGAFGFDMTYKGSGSGDANTLILHADNQDAATKVAVMTVTQAGVVSFANTVNCNISGSAESAGSATLASTVTVGTGSGDSYRAIVVHNGNGLYSAGTESGKPQYNYSTGDVKAKSFTTDGGQFNGNATTASSLKPITAVSSKTLTLKSNEWIATGYEFTSVESGTYVVQVTSGTNLVASGIMSVYKNLSDSIGDEIPLHVYGTADWRPYLRTFANRLEIAHNTVEDKSRTVTIKIAKIL